MYIFTVYVEKLIVNTAKKMGIPLQVAKSRLLPLPIS